MASLERLWKSPQLPTLPTVAARLLDLVRSPDSTIEDVIAVVRSDPALCAKIIKSANDSYFGARSEIKAIDRAISFLGITVSTSLALSFVLTDDCMQRGSLAGHYQRYWRQSVVHAAVAETIGKKLTGRDSSEFFVMGLLLSIGRLAMLKTISTEYLPVLEQADAEQRLLYAVEQDQLGYTHAYVGAKLMETWKLPGSLCQAAEHQADASLDTIKAANAEDSIVVQAGALAASVGDYFCSLAKGYALERMRQLYPIVLGNSKTSLETFLAECEQRLPKMASLFEVDLSDLGPSTDLMIQANEQLLQLTLREHVSHTQAQLNHEALSQEKQRLEQQNRVLQAQVVHDPLTELYNRKFFDESIAREASRCQRQATALAVIFSDVDRFKSLNDTYGHAFGDLVLREIAKRFRESIRSSDVLARYGGEEFVVLVHQPTEKGLETLANRIRERVASEPFSDGTNTVTVTCSLGGAIAIPGRRERNIAEKIVVAADQAMYAAKHGGRNRAIITSLVSPEERQLQQQVTNQRFSRWLVQKRFLDIPTISRALLECPQQTIRLGELAVQSGHMTADQVDEILYQQESVDVRFGELALRAGFLDQSQLIHLLTMQQECPRDVAATIVRLGLLAPDVAAGAHEQYQREQLARLSEARATQNASEQLVSAR